MEQRYKRGSVIFGFVALLILLGFNAWITRRELTIQVGNAFGVQHADQDRAELIQIQSLLIDAETGQRGYLLTDDTTYLQPYSVASVQVDSHLANFARLTAGDPAQQAEIPQLRRLSHQKLDELAQTIALQQAGKPGEARALVLSDKGRILMEQIRALVADMNREELSRQTDRLEDYRRSVQVTAACIDFASGVAALGLVLLAFYVLREMELRRRYAAEIQQRQEWFRVTLTSIGDGVVATDSRARVTFLNPVAEQMLGRDLSYAQGRPISEVFPIFNETTLEPVENPVSKVMQFGKIVGLANHTVLKRSDGALTPIEDSAAPIFDSRNHIVGVVLVFRDATVERKAQSLLRRTDKLSTASRFAATVAHEINNPLEAVGNLIYLAKGAPGLPAAAAEHLTHAEQELERVAHITRQTLGFFRESVGAQTIELAELADSVLRIYRSRLNNKQIRVERDFGECPPIQGMAGELTQVLSNLLANAVDAVSEGGAIRIGLGCVEGADPATVRVSIEDNGAGIAPEHRASIFEPFFTTKKDVGTGLGLWVTKEIVNRHGGTIEVRSAESGSCFSVLLPVLTEPSA